MSVGISYTDATYNDKYVVSAYIYTNWLSVGTTAFTDQSSVGVSGLWYSEFWLYGVFGSRECEDL